jgi:hypothetical protein
MTEFPARAGAATRVHAPGEAAGNRSFAHDDFDRIDGEFWRLGHAADGTAGSDLEPAGPR